MAFEKGLTTMHTQPQLGSDEDNIGFDNGDTLGEESVVDSSGPSDSEEPLATTSESTGFSFDDLLSEARDHAAEGRQLRKNRKALKSGRLTGNTSLQDLLDDTRRLESKREWLPLAATAMFQIQECAACGNLTASFTGIFQKQRHAYVRDTYRWVPANDDSNKNLTKEVKTSNLKTPFCGFCLDEAGYPADQLGVDFGAEEEDGPSAEEQEQLDFEAQQDEIAESLQTTSTSVIS